MKKRLLSLALALVMSLSLLPMGAAAAEPGAPVPRSVSFVDVKKGDWFYAGVQYSVSKGLFAGMPGNRFAPKDQITRAMVVQNLYALAGKPKVSKTKQFPDVKNSDWFADAVAWAVKNGVASGYNDGRFGPDDTITREQMAVMLHGYQKKPYSNQFLNFGDAGEISGWARSAVRWVVEKKLMNGVEGNCFAPGATATRAEGAVIMMQFDRLLRNGDKEPGSGGENQLPIG